MSGKQPQSGPGQAQTTPTSADATGRAGVAAEPAGDLMQFATAHAGQDIVYAPEYLINAATHAPVKCNEGGVHCYASCSRCSLARAEFSSRAGWEFHSRQSSSTSSTTVNFGASDVGLGVCVNSAATAREHDEKKFSGIKINQTGVSFWRTTCVWCGQAQPSDSDVLTFFHDYLSGALTSDQARSRLASVGLEIREMSEETADAELLHDFMTANMDARAAAGQPPEIHARANHHRHQARASSTARGRPAAARATEDQAQPSPRVCDMTSEQLYHYLVQQNVDKVVANRMRENAYSGASLEHFNEEDLDFLVRLSVCQ
ncbi:uncharacterized protein MONBRDRAFT_12132 [Monosiga brevicollis MX1]|uniref:Uncharacterized protein n=1 Tax=Monosiga brevicollis TaxID=81824 RepID=A9VBB4_MONBE|nr:uncharacterized protein MONBRDRAFT_12132 [Monosiga brevicollis MX1]EDQ85207.1 predicted protein [Monosiga brevicollis MX1]|eukprot:XP_001750032.1 hypothetical protein [Monosiga brevicollis MX1]